MSNLPTVYFCPWCGAVKHSENAGGPRRCCPDSALEFVTEETARLASIGFRALVHRELPPPMSAEVGAADGYVFKEDFE